MNVLYVPVYYFNMSLVQPLKGTIMETISHLDVVWYYLGLLIKDAFLVVSCFILSSFRSVYDVHETLNITVFDEDRRGAPEFLGRVAIPLLSVSHLCTLLGLEFPQVSLRVPHGSCFCLLLFLIILMSWCPTRALSSSIFCTCC